MTIAMNPWKKFSLTLLSLAAVVAFTACTGKKHSADTISMRLPGDPPTIDWTLANDNVSKEAISLIQDSLVETDLHSKVRPALAESWTISPDGKTYTFKIRKGVVWSDGQPLVAQHFVDSWERLINAKTASEYAYFLFDVKGAKEYNEAKITDFNQVSIKAPSPDTFQVELTKPVSFWIYIPTFWVTDPIRKDVVAKFGDKWTDPDKIVTLGSYLLKGWERESKLSFEKNPNYWDKEKLATMPPKAEFRVVKEDSTAVTLFNSGALDIVRDLPPLQIPILSKLPTFSVHPWLRGYYVGFNTKDPQVSDVRVRKAMAMAINRKELLDILGMMVDPTAAWIPKELLEASKTAGIAYDATEAKKLWDSIPNKPTSIEYWYDQKDMNKLVAENLQNQWKRVLGLDVKLATQEWKVYLKALHGKSSPALWRMGWGADYPHPDTFMNLFTCASGNNFTQFCNKTFDDLVSKAAGEQDESKRNAQYTEAQKLLLEESIAIVPLFTLTNIHLVSQRVVGFAPNPMGDFYLKDIKLK